MSIYISQLRKFNTFYCKSIPIHFFPILSIFEQLILESKKINKISIMKRKNSSIAFLFENTTTTNNLSMTSRIISVRSRSLRLFVRSLNNFFAYAHSISPSKIAYLGFSRAYPLEKYISPALSPTRVLFLFSFSTFIDCRQARLFLLAHCARHGMERL